MEHENLEAKFIGILEQNAGIIYKISSAYTNLDQDREDLINDIVLELWKSFKKFKGNSKISTWLYRVALNTSMNYKRKTKKDNSNLFISDLKQFEALPIIVQHEFEQSETLELLFKCIDELNEINKAIILLYLDGNSHDEISEITGISKTNVGTRIGRIKDQLRSLVQEKSE